MKILKNKTKISAITFVLMFTISAMIVALPTVAAHDPAWTIPTWTYLEAYPNPIGVGQPIFLVFWRDYLPRTAEGMFGDRWDFTIEVTKPDNSKQTLGPITCDPVGGGYTFYTPDQVGTYSFVAYFPGHVYGTNGLLNPENTVPYGQIWYDDVLLPSQSEPDTVVVQQDPIPEPTGFDLPTGYWTRPISSDIREWNTISGNWLNDGRRNDDIDAPRTAHIVWTKENNIGGLTGGLDYGTIGYYEGSSYERKWTPVSIINGRLYYRTARSSQPNTQGTMCVDLRTGEELLFMNRTLISQGVIYNYESPNQHGTIPYLVVAGQTQNIFDPSATTSSYAFYDPFTGEWLWTAQDRPGNSVAAVGANGEPLLYVFDFNNNWMALWNATAIADLYGGTSGTGIWQWRPVGKTVEGTARTDIWQDAIEWNVSIPAGIEGQTWNIKVLSDRVLILQGFQRFGGRAYDSHVRITALSLKPENAGQIIFDKDYTTPPLGSANMTLQLEGDIADEENGIFVMKVKESLQWYGFDLDTGTMVWGPTEAMEPFMMYDRASTIYRGKLYSEGYSGVYCYDIKTGAFQWLFRTDKNLLEGPYEYWPVSTCVFADGLMYVTTGEHSHTQPLNRGWSMYCANASTGERLWQTSGVWGTPVLADGYMVDMNGMDNQIYCFGKGQTQTTLEGPLAAIPDGTSVIIQGTVMDKSPGAMSDGIAARYPNGLPAISDADMNEWMEHVYKQHPLSMETTGVSVTLDAIDPNGNFINIATVTTDLSGSYSYLWEPEHQGKYTVLATFEGSDAYYSSYAETAIGVGPASTPGTPIEPEPTEPEPLITTEIAIIAAIVIAAIIGIVAFWALRKRK